MSELIDLAAIEARCNAATAGPWMWCLGSGGMIGTGIKTRADGVLICDVSPDWILEDPRTSRLRPDHRGDLSFIEHSRADIPALIARIRELEGEVKRLSEHEINLPWIVASLKAFIREAHEAETGIIRIAMLNDFCTRLIAEIHDKPLSTMETGPSQIEDMTKPKEHK